MAKADTKPVIIIELNEFNTQLVKQTLKTHDLPNLKKVFNFKQTSYKTNDRYNSGFLEPWVQWVSVHTGKPASEHKIKHLGDVPDCQYPPFWQTLSDMGVSTGIWGVMNGQRGESPNNHFFFPDPWTFTERAYPEPLNRFLELPRYLSKNYRNLKKGKTLRLGFSLFKGLLQSGCFKAIWQEIKNLRKSLKKHGKHHYLYISSFDYVVSLLFTQWLKKTQPDVGVLFLNSIAHIQHHHWRDGELNATPEILHGLEKIDAILSHLFEHFPEHRFVVHNGLSQMNTNHEKPWVLYRQKDPMQCLQALGLTPVKVEQHMTHDGHAFFKTEQERDAAFDTLKAIRINHQPLFLVEKNQEDSTKLFYQLAFTDALEKGASFESQDTTHAFFDLFDSIVTRTGRHIPRGTVFSDHIRFMDHMFNHEFNQSIYHYFFPEKFPMKHEFIEDEAKACAQPS